MPVVRVEALLEQFLSAGRRRLTTASDFALRQDSMLRKLLDLGRYLLVVPVIGSLLLTVGVIVMSAGLIVDRAIYLMRDGEFSTKSAKLEHCHV